MLGSNPTVRLSSLKNNKLILRQLRWDVTPEVLFKPRFVGIGSEKDVRLQRETDGYMFYVDSLGKKTALMLMRTISMMSQTVAEVEGAPEEMLDRAVRAEGVKSYAGMYPLSTELEEWIKAELGLSA
jgi:hypothetical protein